jgi:hypothetical protein
MLGDPDCGSQTVGTRSHYHGIIFIPLLHVGFSVHRVKVGRPIGIRLDLPDIALAD